MNKDREIIENNRKIVTEIIQKVQNKEPLDTQQILYFQILFNNKMISVDGSLTEEGIQALYN